MKALLAQYPNLPVLLGAWLGGGAAIGLAIGWWRNRLGSGLLLGMLLGPIGWFTVGRLSGRFRECPACSRPVRVGAELASLDRRTTRSELNGRTRNQPW